MTMTCPSDGDAIAKAWTEVDHAERRAKAVCYRCECEGKNHGFKSSKPATRICLAAPGWLLCDTCATLALIAGWKPVDLDSVEGRAALAKVEG